MGSKNLNIIEKTKAIVLFLVLTLFLSCIFKVKKCPLPTCEIRKTHRHLLIFSEAPKDKKKLFGFLKKKVKQDSVSSSTFNLDSTNQLLTDSIKGTKKVKSKKKIKTEDTKHEASFVEVDGQVLDEEGNVFVDPKTQKKQETAKRKKEKKEAKKKKKADKKALKKAERGDSTQTSELENSEQALNDEDNENDYSGMTEEEYKHHRQHNTSLDTTEMHQYNEKELAKQLKKEDKANAKKLKAEEKLARKGKKGQADYTRLYRSRITKWWRKDQNPKIGKYFKREKESIHKEK